MLSNKEVTISCKQDGEIMDANRNATIFFGEDIIGKNINEIVDIKTKINPENGKKLPFIFSLKKDLNSGSVTFNTKEHTYSFSVDKYEDIDRCKFLSTVAMEAIAMTHNKLIIDCNQQFIEMYGYHNMEEVIGLSIDDFVPPEHREKANKLLEKETYEKEELINVRKDGSLITIESRGMYMDYMGKKVRVSVMYDITERKSIEKKLIESERKFSAILSHLPGMAYRIDITQNNKLDFVSDGCYPLTGYQKQELMQVEELKFNDLILPEDRIYREKKIKSLKKDNLNIEYRIRTKDNQIKWVLEKATFIKLGNKQTLLEGFITDVTDKKENEIKLEQSNEQYKVLVEGSPDGVILHKNGKIKYANIKAIQLLEINDTHNFSDITIDFLNSKKDEELDTKNHDYKEIEYINSKEQVLIWSINSIKTTYNGEQVIQSTLRDITKDKKAEEDRVRNVVIREMNEALQAENTKHIETRNKLIAAEKYSRLIINSSLDMIVALDNEGVITDFNKSAEETLGYKSHEIIGRHVSQLYDSMYDFDTVREALKNDGEFYGEIVNKNKEGKTISTLLSASLIKNAEGKVVGSMGVSRDVSKIKEVEQDLKKSESRYRDLIENIGDYIISTDVNGKILYANNSFKKAIEYKDNELLNNNITQFLTPDRKKRSKETLEKIISGKQKYPLHTSFISKSGNKILLEGNTTVKFKHYKPDTIRGIFRDITANKQVEQVVKSQTAKMKSIFDSAANVLIWSIDKSYQITSMNTKFKETLHKYCEINVQKNDVFSKILMPHFEKGYYRELMFIRFKNALKGNSEQFEICMVDRYNKKIWFEVFLNPIEVEDSNSIHEVSCMAHIINERKEAAAKIKKSLEEKSVLLKEVHHRVKNNLQVISSILNLQSSLVKDENTLNILRESQSRIRTMSFIHESLYRTEDFSEINFTEYLTNLSKNLVSSYAVVNNVKLELNLPKIQLNLDQAIPCGLLVNEIVTNSLKYAFKGGEEAKIFLQMEDFDDEIRLLIGDNGIGLPENYEDFSSETLGVQLIEALTNQLDGQLKVENKEGTKYLLTFRKQN